MLVGIDIGGTKTRIAIAKLANKLISTREFPTPNNQTAFSDILFKTLGTIINLSAINAVGIASPGPINKSRGIIIQPMNLDWQNFKIIDELKMKLNCPIILEHDATCGGIAEATFGAGSNINFFVFVTISTGIGTSIILNKKPLPGPHNSEGGHMIVDLEQNSNKTKIITEEELASGKAIYLRYGKIARDLTKQADWQKIARNISFGIYNIMTLVDPEAIILAGGVTTNYPKFIHLLKQNITNIPHLYEPCNILLAKYIETAPLIGAIYLANQSLSNNRTA